MPSLETVSIRIAADAAHRINKVRANIEFIRDRIQNMDFPEIMRVDQENLCERLDRESAEIQKTQDILDFLRDT